MSGKGKRTCYEAEIKRVVSGLLNKYFPIGISVRIRPNINAVRYLWFTGTYIIYSGKKIIYVGISENISNRLLNHERLAHSGDGSFGKEISHIKIVRFKHWEQAEALESLIINELRPKYNRTIPLYHSYLYRLTATEQKETIITIGLILKALRNDLEGRNV